MEAKPNEAIAASNVALAICQLCKNLQTLYS
jgi:hypothetical protein